jgi:hypothetical protein
VTAPDPTHVPMAGRLTFMRQPRTTGLAGIARPHPDTTIKIAGREVGTISPPHMRAKDNYWRIRLMRVLPDRPAGCWESILLVYRAKDEADARAFVQRVDARVRAMYNLHAFAKETK